MERNSIPLGTMAAMHGQAAPASGSTDGSRQGLSVDWRTPQASEAGAKVETLYTKDGQPAKPGQRAYRKAPDGRMVLQSQTINQQVEMVQNWATPRAGKTTDENPETWAKRQAKGDVATMPLTAQVKSWVTPRNADSRNPGPTNCKPGSMMHLGTQAAKQGQSWATTDASDRRSDKSRQVGLSNQMKSETWPTPASAGVTGGPTGLAGGAGNREKLASMLPEAEAKAMGCGKLNPRWVETLMGLPVGWTMPSCASPVTIERTNSGYSATVLSRQQQNEPSEH